MAKVAKKEAKKTVKRKTTKAKPKAKRKTAAKPKTKRKSGLAQMFYTVSPELQAVVGAKKLTRPEIVKKLWVYIKAHKCQDMKNRRMINPDQKLSEVLGKKQIDMLKMAGQLNKHIEKA
ncbi:MAG: hypothetical protein IT584_00010 [Chlamydiae bacterium]|nr:hypothetical protein [Chlamydiota bacterium]